MTLLAVAVVVLLLTHFSSSTPLRPAFVRRFGEAAWLGLYSLVALAAFGAVIQAWRAAPVVWLWPPSIGVHHATLALMPVAWILIVGSQTDPNPASFGKDALLADPSPRGVLRITRHPMLWGTGLWAVLHLAANPDAASWWLFGGLAVLSFGGTALQDHKKRRDLGEAWRAWEATTSNLPFLAIARGRTRLAPRELAVAGAGGLLTYAALLVAHPWLAGVGILP